jgi:hypothetical protein
MGIILISHDLGVIFSFAPAVATPARSAAPCRTAMPALRRVCPAHEAACHFAEDIRTHRLTEDSPDAS